MKKKKKGKGKNTIQTLKKKSLGILRTFTWNHKTNKKRNPNQKLSEVIDFLGFVYTKS